jgi:tripartite-type tricarboxylate transporter receptor subunit TctC
MIVPFPPGGGIDTTARITAQKLSEVIGQQIVVENQGGGGGVIATGAVVNAAPDGYTLLYHSTTGIVHAAVTPKLPYDWLKDLAPVSITTRFAPVMVVSPTLPVKDLKEFIALLKANPGKYSYASSGTGTAVHLAEELFRQKAGVDMVHVPYRGTIAAMPDLIAGRVAMMIDGVPVQTKNIQAGTVKALAVTTEARSPALPEVPTMKELGLDYVVPYWTAVYAPAKTPQPVIDRMVKEITAILARPDLQERYAKSGLPVTAEPPDAFRARIAREVPMYKEIVDRAGLKIQ